MLIFLTIALFSPRFLFAIQEESSLSDGLVYYESFNNATINSLIPNFEGEYNQAKYFNGDTQFVYTNPNASLPVRNSNRSICMWAWPNPDMGWSFLFDYSSPISQPNGFFDFQLIANVLHLSISSGESPTLQMSNDKLPTYEWTHICITFESTRQLIRSWINGQPIRNYTHTINTVTEASARFGFRYVGWIDEATFYNRTLSQQEIALLSKKPSRHPSRATVFPTKSPTTITKIPTARTLSPVRMPGEGTKQPTIKPTGKKGNSSNFVVDFLPYIFVVVGSCLLCCILAGTCSFFWYRRKNKIMESELTLQPGASAPIPSSVNCVVLPRMSSKNMSQEGTVFSAQPEVPGQDSNEFQYNEENFEAFGNAGQYPDLRFNETHETNEDRKIETGVETETETGTRN